MSKSKNTPAKPASGGFKKAASGKPAQSGSAAVRETVESVVIAFVLAFLFRTFEAEAFVIPTGSMAPTLMGRHMDLQCPACGYRYQLGASEQTNRETNQTYAIPVTGGTCPMCRRPADLSSNNPENITYPTYNGDRILVGKFAYQFNDPQRWDVAVFRYPGDAQTNYIKRLVGLPGETLRIQYGNIYARRDGGEFGIARKPPDKMLAVLQPVYDNDLTPQLVERFGLPPRWLRDPGGQGGFEARENDRWYETDGNGPETAWLHYKHRIPTVKQWHTILTRGHLAEGAEVAPRAIDDFAAYNTSRTSVHQLGRYEEDPHHWVGDLTVGCTVNVLSDAGELSLQLVKGGRRFLCQINLNDGVAKLSIEGNSDFNPTAKTTLRGRGKHDLLFTNVDDQLRLFVDGTPVVFGDSDAATCYDGTANNDLTRDDLTPASIGARGVAVQVSHLTIARDLYYIAQPLPGGGSAEAVDQNTLASPAPRGGAHGYGWQRGRLHNIASPEYPLGPDDFLMLGDNSAMSKDSRLWMGDGVDSYAVRRDLLIGKAIFIYWPHSWNTPVPFWPNLSRMGFVR